MQHCDQPRSITNRPDVHDMQFAAALHPAVAIFYKKVYNMYTYVLIQ